MIESIRSAELADRVGGKFKLTALVQKRLLELMQGARPLIENTEGKTHLEIVVQEILENKIGFDRGEGGKGDRISEEPLNK